MDGLGNAWVANNSNNSISELSNAGVPLSPSTGYTGGGVNQPSYIAIDGSGNVWTANAGPGNNGSVTELIGGAAPVVTPIALGVKNHSLGARP
jgi:DNA-binding beta-propeller fold protein YncE